MIPEFEEFGEESELRNAARFMRSDDERLRILRQALTTESDGREDRENRMFDTQSDIDPMLRERGGYFDEDTVVRNKPKRTARSFEELTTADRTRYLEVDADYEFTSQPSLPSAPIAPIPPSASGSGAGGSGGGGGGGGLKITLKRGDAAPSKKRERDTSIE